MAEAHEKNIELLHTLAKRWSLWLAVGNIGGLAYALERVSQGLNTPLAMLLWPSCWAFVVGLLGAGGFNLVGMLQGDAYVLFNEANTKEEEAIQQKRIERFDYLSGYLNMVGISGFCFGLLYPMVILTKRLVLTGSMLG